MRIYGLVFIPNQTVSQTRTILFLVLFIFGMELFAAGMGYGAPPASLKALDRKVSLFPCQQPMYEEEELPKLPLDGSVGGTEEDEDVYLGPLGTMAATSALGG